MKRLIHLLKSPFPFSEEACRKWGVIIGVGFFVWFFLAVFQPFGLYDLQMKNKDWFFAGYGLLTSFVLFIMFWLFPKMIPGFFNESNWTLGKHLMWLLIMVFLIGVGNFFYSCLIHVFKCSPRVFLMFQFYTTVIGLFPTIGLTMYSHKTLKAKYSSEAENISKDHSNNVRVKNSPVKEIQLISNSASESDLLIPLHSLYAIASDGNYIRVFLEGKKDIQKKILRKTLKETEDELSGHREILRVHRGYLVNISKIKCVTGNAQGLILHFENPELTIPVSRKFIDSLRNNYNHL